MLLSFLVAISASKYCQHIGYLYLITCLIVIYSIHHQAWEFQGRYSRILDIWIRTGWRNISTAKARELVPQRRRPLLHHWDCLGARVSSQDENRLSRLKTRKSACRRGRTHENHWLRFRQTDLRSHVHVVWNTRVPRPRNNHVNRS